MNATKTFIEKAIEGGWQVTKKMETYYFGGGKVYLHYVSEHHVTQVPVSDIFLDPKAWEAVGRTFHYSKSKEADTAYGKMYAKEKMHQMIDALIEGKSIEEYLTTLIK